MVTCKIQFHSCIEVATETLQGNSVVAVCAVAQDPCAKCATSAEYLTIVFQQ